MAIISGGIAGLTAFDKATGGTITSTITGGVKKLFGGGIDFAQQNRNRKREALERVGFNWRKTSGVPAGEEWNIDNFSDRALDNVARLYDRWGELAVKVHNDKKIANSQVAENFETLEQIVLTEEQKQKPNGFGSQGFFAGGSDSQIVQAGTGIVTALAIAGGLFWVISKG